MDERLRGTGIQSQWSSPLTSIKPGNSKWLQAINVHCDEADIVIETLRG
jgi:hypothetical protein